MIKIKNKLFSLMCKLNLHKYRTNAKGIKSGRTVLMQKCKRCGKDRVK